MSTSQQGQLLTEKAAEYAYEMTAKNAAHTAIQMAMNKINGDDNWVINHASEAEAWEDTIDGASVKLYIDTLNNTTDNEYWKADSLRMISKATVSQESDDPFEATVTSVYLKERFSSLVPEFGAPIQIPTGYGSFSVDGNAHSIDGVDESCGVSKPPITVGSQEIKDDLQTKDLNFTEGGEISVDTTLSYQPTDELIKRLEKNATYLTSDFDDQLGSPEKPGVFFVDGDVKLTGKTTGYGILVIRGGSSMNMEDPELSVAGNFTFNGLIIFENAELFDGHGTPTINGSILIGDTEGADDIQIDIGGNISINYTCAGENYANMAAADASNQHKYTQVVTYEEIGS
ncbi:MAG TPA: hypothetical protein VF181_12830 [Balneolaceae bacterium]